MSKLISTNPAKHYEVVGEVEVSTKEEVHEKVAKAQAARNVWRELGAEGRVKLLEPIREELLRRTDEFVNLICRETGKSAIDAKSEMSRYAGDELGWFLENGAKALTDEVTLQDDESVHKIVFEPYGVAAAIAPWNFPLGMAIWAIFPNLIAGNTVVFKTSEECPLTGKLLEEVIGNHALPDGVFGEVYGAGDVGKILSESDINLIWFTGSTRTGRQLYKTAADKFIKAILEMGGSNPCVVFDDVNIAAAAPVIFNGRYRNNGQFCSALKRLIVQEGVAKELVLALKAIIEKQNVNEPFAAGAELGSLVAKRQKDLLDEQYQDALAKGATIAAQSTLPANLQGAFFPPTLLANVTKDMRVWNEEVFGPLLPMVTFKTEEEAVELANDTIYGLGGRVMSGDIKRAERVASKIDAGSIALNAETRLAACDPFGGYKYSGLGRERGNVGFQELCQVKVIQSRKDDFASA